VRKNGNGDGGDARQRRGVWGGGGGGGRIEVSAATVSYGTAAAGVQAVVEECRRDLGLVGRDSGLRTKRKTKESYGREEMKFGCVRTSDILYSIFFTRVKYIYGVVQFFSLNYCYIC
jgi:hypothetical protein